MNIRGWSYAALIFGICILFAMTRLAEADDSAPELLNPVIVGSWGFRNITRNGAPLIIWTINADGRFRMVTTAGNRPPQTGQIHYTDGQWSFQADSPGKPHDVFDMLDEDTISIPSEIGPQIWWHLADHGAAGAPNAGQSVADPAMVGRWRASLPAGAGEFDWTLDIKADGHYFSMVRGPGAITPPAETGQIGFANGTWHLKSDGGRTDQGICAVIDQDSVILKGQKGAAVWWHIPDELPGPQHDLSDAFQKLALISNYTWERANITGSNVSPPPGKTEKDGLRLFSYRKYLIAQAAKVGPGYGLQAVSLPDGWMRTDDDRLPEEVSDYLVNANLISPVDIYLQLRAGLVNVRRTGFGYEADVGPRTVLKAYRLMGVGINISAGRGSQITGTMQFWISGGVPSRIEGHFLAAHHSASGAGMSIPMSFAQEITQVGTTTIDAPEKVRAMLLMK